MLADSVFVPRVNALKISVHFIHQEVSQTTNALVDTGATHNFLTPQLVELLDLQPQKLPKQRTIRNVDGTLNKSGRIESYVDLELRPKNWWNMVGQKQRFYLADLGEDQMILGYPWMAANNEPLDWSNPARNPQIFASRADWVLQKLQLEEGDELFMRI